MDALLSEAQRDSLTIAAFALAILQLVLPLMGSRRAQRRGPKFPSSRLRSSWVFDFDGISSYLALIGAGSFFLGGGVCLLAWVEPGSTWSLNIATFLAGLHAYSLGTVLTLPFQARIARKHRPIRGLDLVPFSILALVGVVVGFKLLSGYDWTSLALTDRILAVYADGTGIAGIVLLVQLAILATGPLWQAWKRKAQRSGNR